MSSLGLKKPYLFKYCCAVGFDIRSIYIPHKAWFRFYHLKNYVTLLINHMIAIRVNFRKFVRSRIFGLYCNLSPPSLPSHPSKAFQIGFYPVMFYSSFRLFKLQTPPK
jgi:hypothetical protein